MNIQENNLFYILLTTIEDLLCIVWTEKTHFVLFR